MESEAKERAIKLLRRLESSLVYKYDTVRINADEWAILWSAVTDNVACDHCSSGNIDWQHHDETPATPECWVPICQDCGRQGQPE